jgi:hypothetical protein
MKGFSVPCQFNQSENSRSDLQDFPKLSESPDWNTLFSLWIVVRIEKGGRRRFGFSQALLLERLSGAIT